MKKGQMMSQPFYYIFAIIVIGLILIFGFKYAGKLFKVGCEVEVVDFVNDIKKEINELKTLSYGSSRECFVTKSSGENKCEFILPNDVEGICFIDTTKGQFEDILFKDVKELVSNLGESANRNLFLSVRKGGNCEADPVMIKNLKIDKPVCLKSGKSFIMENTGNTVEIKMS